MQRYALYLFCLIALSLSKHAYSEQSPLCLWQLNETNGTTAFDGTGNGLDGTLYGQMTFENSSIEGTSNNALLFDGLDDCVLRTFTLQQWPAYTVSLWVKAGSLGQTMHKAVFNTHTGSSNGFQIAVDGGNPGIYRYVSPYVTINIGAVSTEWLHLAAVYDGTNVKVYYNGQPANSASSAAVSFNQFAIGKNRDSNRFFHGAIDEMRVYNSALNDAEVLSLYQDPHSQPIVYGPLPAIGTWDVGVNSNLTWQTAGVSGFTPKYNVYLGTSAGSLYMVSEKQTDPLYAPPLGMSAGIHYFWRVDIVNAGVSPNIVYPGRVWDFVTYEEAFDVLVWNFNSFFESGQSYHFTDSSGFANDGTYVHPSFAAPNLTTGLIGNAIMLSGAGDHITCSDVQKIDSNWSANLYFNIFQESENWTRIANLPQNVSCYLLENQIGVVVDGQYILIPNTIINRQQWYMLTVTVSTTQIRIYVNGVEQIQRDLPLISSDAIGQYANLPSVFKQNTFAGLLDEFVLYRGVLSLADIQSLASILPNPAEMNDTGVVDVSDLGVFADDWLHVSGQVLSAYTLDDFESYNSQTFGQNWLPREDMPSDNALTLLTSGGYSSTKAALWEYDFKDGRVAGVEFQMPQQVFLGLYDEVHIRLLRSPGSDGERLWCKFINADWPIAGNIWEMGEARYPQGVEGLPENQWTEWIIPLNSLQSYTLDYYQMPSDRINNLARLSFGIYSENGGTGAIRVDDIWITRKNPLCSSIQWIHTDINGDCRVDMHDFYIFAGQWMEN